MGQGVRPWCLSTSHMDFSMWKSHFRWKRYEVYMYIHILKKKKKNIFFFVDR